MKYRIKHSVHLIAYTGKFTYYTINASQTMEYVFAQTLEYARNYYINYGKTLLPF